MAKVGFFTAVSFGDQPKSCTQSMFETVDSYFYLGGKKAYVIPGHAQQGIEGAVLAKDSPAFVITALKVISYLTVALPVVMLIAKAILRSIHSFHIVDVKQKLEEGIDISQDTIEKIQVLMPKIRDRQNQDDQEIVRYTSKSVFSLRSVPNLIFKSVGDADGRVENMVKAKEVCLAHQLGLLIIPHAKKFHVDGRTLIAEECFDVQQHESAQERLYSELSGLNETTRQLATFIAKTGFSDVEWRNMPIIDDAPVFQGSRRVALVDLEEMDSPEIGIFGGGLGRRGLIRCLSSEEQIDIALAEAGRHGIVNQYVTPAQVKARRIDEVQNYEQLQRFYVRNGILENARKPIQVDDLSTLGLNLDEQGDLRIPEVRSNASDGEASEYRHQPITLRDAVIDVIAQINDAINKTSENASIKGKRYILLNTHHSRRLQDYHRLGLPEDKVFVTEEEENQIWLRRIINALVAKGHLFKLDKVNGHGYFIQA
ncbi:MAG: hypothetical protein ACD_17C00291G0004 [uncultured bacterium]|nr:MAG: hypothetical protein ACD_17C00291G0004 [uncultured bacterium]OGN55869.1 MAG: hypothetical protein A2796_07420 [Chlamydiae bacterium RIFCSPHIGHO2_01_FULL_44_39]OGN57321.1 MAG: hypothetical protein A3C42_03185 [Chlamydiae bacterium RIFCSPHIGHO2_02_FULL_45_9]OGN60818.1 MAG: hypothetical protein A3D96_00275 [Chlamydiae bacterium RIFCSPHIGHO2_12_FULL_44_59]OGN66694.1 MAG: hypothetical protein A2978_02910 [Chlamydiae bacterium RIFCSPLOWO2_01_FULL_44_52]OGN67344.1 MAG: hypothetical protein A3